MSVPGRLQKRSEFLRVAASRWSAATPGLVLQAGRPRVAQSEIRVGFTASRRVGGAVQRNRARRRLRALASKIIADRAEPGYDYVLIARTGTPTRSWLLLNQDLQKALRRLKLWRD